MKVYVLIAVMVNYGLFGSTTVTTTADVFQSAGRCIRNVEPNRSKLEKKYDQVTIQCMEKELLK